jgi:hypothetical protein
MTIAFTSALAFLGGFISGFLTLLLVMFLVASQPTIFTPPERDDR